MLSDALHGCTNSQCSTVGPTGSTLLGLDGVAVARTLPFQEVHIHIQLAVASS